MMEAGLDLDDLIAPLMGWRIAKDPEQPWCSGWRAPSGRWYLTTPAYSTDIKWAWQVLERLRTHFVVILGNTTSHGLSNGWSISVYFKWKGRYKNTRPDPIATVEGENAPHAICLAAIQAFKFWGENQ